MNEKLPAPCEHCRASGLRHGSVCNECQGKGYRLFVNGSEAQERLPRRPASPIADRYSSRCRPARFSAMLRGESFTSSISSIPIYLYLQVAGLPPVVTKHPQI
jgi:hypothetical protein